MSARLGRRHLGRRSGFEGFQMASRWLQERSRTVAGIVECISDVPENILLTSYYLLLLLSSLSPADSRASCLQQRPKSGAWGVQGASCMLPEPPEELPRHFQTSQGHVRQMSDR